VPDMRFAPPNPMRIADRASGLNAISVRSHNERLVLSLLLQNQGMSRMEIGEQTGLSAQTVSVIVRSLEQEGLVAKGEAQKGRVGPPTIPLSLNPEGAYSVGVSIGNRNTEVVLIDFIGSVKFYACLQNPASGSDGILPEIVAAVLEAAAALPANARGRIAGIGLALPEDVGSAKGLSGAAAQSPGAVQHRIESEAGLPVFVQNDVTAAAGGESMFGAAKSLSDYLYFFLGARLQSRLILNHQIYHGNSSMSFDVGLQNLETRMTKSGAPVPELWDRNASWPLHDETFGTWRQDCLAQLNQTISSLTQFVEIKTIVLSSYAPKEICREICADLERSAPGVRALVSNVAAAPKAVGAASLPFSSRFIVE
jgi:biotin operon repressor